MFLWDLWKQIVDVFNHFKIFIFIVLFLLSFVLLLGVSASTSFYNYISYKETRFIPSSQKILVIQSYYPDHLCGYPQEEGFLDSIHNHYYNNYSKPPVHSEDKTGGLSINSDNQFYVFTFYCRTKYTNISIIQRKNKIEELVDFYNQIKPTYIYTIDDNAFKYTISDTDIIHNHPIFFSGLNNNPYQYIDHISNNNRFPIIGTTEYVKTNKLFEFFKSVNYFPEYVYIFYDDTDTSYALTMFWREAFIEHGIIPTIKKITALDALYFQQIKKNSLIVFNIQRLWNSRYHRYENIDQLLKQVNSIFKNSFILLTNNTQLEYGGTMSYGPDFYTMGYETGKLLINYISNPDVSRDLIIQSNPIISVRLSKIPFSIPISIIRRFGIYVY